MVNKSVKNNGIVVDHKGLKYISVRSMCKRYGVPLSIYNTRRAKGWDIQKSLETPCIKRIVTADNKWVDHKGNKFNSFIEMCEHWEIEPNLVNCRLTQGKSLEYALTYGTKTYKDELLKSMQAEIKNMNDLKKKRNTRSKPFDDHLGNHFDSLSAMAEYWGVKAQTIKYRLDHGMTIEQALTAAGYSSNRGPRSKKKGSKENEQKE